MAPGDFAEVPLRVFASDDAAATDAATRVPGPLSDGAPLDPVEVAAWHHADDGGGTDYEDPAVLRAGDSGQTAGTVGACLSADLPGPVDPGSGAGDGGGE